MPSVTFIRRQLASIRLQAEAAARGNHNLHYQACSALNRLREDLINASNLEFAEHIRHSVGTLRSSDGDPPYPEDGGAALLICDLLIDICEEEIEGVGRSAVGCANSGLDVFEGDEDEYEDGNDEADDSNVFIVHGHDEANLLRLEKLLEKRWSLTPVILRDRASSGQTIIEKFEANARRCGFAFILITPDDQVGGTEGAVYQARPNVVFELGWFYGRLGRDRVCILYQTGTQIHSDLSGVLRIEFNRTIEESIGEIENELRAGGLI
jgi:hypothetical protein